MTNIKDIMTNIATWLFSIGGALVGFPILLDTYVKGINIPSFVIVIGVICLAVGGAINGHYGGKNDDGTTKLPEQITGGGK